MPNVYQFWAPQTPAGLEPEQDSNGTAFTVAKHLQLASQIQFMKIVQRADELEALLWWFAPASHITPSSLHRVEAFKTQWLLYVPRV